MDELTPEQLVCGHIWAKLVHSAESTIRRNVHPDPRANYVLANTPFNDSDWFRKDDDVLCQFGVPPKGYST